ncbi:MAG: GGDEF domain-containing protein [Holosporaceae bacterium]|jgi:diguanylate cyclase (GGDEF)-like protein|nr:GGDEF domain-containing protein [Holosporaceae bacterium]
MSGLSLNARALDGMRLKKCDARKIAMFFYDNVDFLDRSLIKNGEVIMRETWPTTDDVCNSDAFIINIGHPKADECCLDIRSQKSSRYKPIILTYDRSSENKVERIAKLDIGFTDIVNAEANPILIKHRLNSSIKYQKLRQVFSKSLEKGLRLSCFDSATKVYSRSFLENYLKNKSRKLRNVAVIMLDVDNFKSINDNFGHSFADATLKKIAGKIKKCVRTSDIVARYGGDEFVVVINDVTRASAENIAERIRKRIAACSFGNARCSASVGVCCKNGVSTRDAMLIADQFMYAAKRSGGNSVKICWR